MSSASLKRKDKVFLMYFSNYFDKVHLFFIIHPLYVLFSVLFLLSCFSVSEPVLPCNFL